MFNCNLILEEIMRIKHNVYEGGRLQSLSYITDDGEEKSSGAAEPGQYNFGVAGRKETIRIVDGELQTSYGQFVPGGEDLVFEKGQEIIFTVNKFTFYYCLYS